MYRHILFQIECLNLLKDAEQFILSDLSRRVTAKEMAELLESTNMKVIDIVIRVGYENQGKFAKVFSDQYGVSPLEFRRLSK